MLRISGQTGELLVSPVDQVLAYRLRLPACTGHLPLVPSMIAGILHNPWRGNESVVHLSGVRQYTTNALIVPLVTEQVHCMRTLICVLGPNGGRKPTASKPSAADGVSLSIACQRVARGETVAVDQTVTDFWFCCHWFRCLGFCRH